MKKISVIALLICTAAFAQQKGSFTDSRDGKTYKYVIIGKQVWMAENLDYGGKNDDIGECYGKIPENCRKYGALYREDESRKVCPSGWHLPSTKEWQILVNFAGGAGKAARKLKAKSGWNEARCRYTTQETTGRGKVIVTEHDECATDELGFTALPTPGGGSTERREYESSNWWTSDGYAVDMEGMGIDFFDNDFIIDTYVRCVQEIIKPSFDCGKASTTTEKAICSDSDLAELDNRIARAYSKIHPACKLKKTQKEWLKEMESCSSNTQCLKNSYILRIQELESCW